MKSYLTSEHKQMHCIPLLVTNSDSSPGLVFLEQKQTICTILPHYPLTSLRKPLGCLRLDSTLLLLFCPVSELVESLTWPKEAQVNSRVTNDDVFARTELTPKSFERSWSISVKCIWVKCRMKSRISSEISSEYPVKQLTGVLFFLFPLKVIPC